MITIKS